MYYGVAARRHLRAFALLTLVGLVSAAPAQAHPSHAEDARIGAQEAVGATVKRLDRVRSERSTNRVVTGDVVECQRLGGHSYRCSARYEVRIYSLTELTQRQTCTETVGVEISHKDYGRGEARSLGDLVCRDQDDEDAATGPMPPAPPGPPAPPAPTAPN